jgi:hypothetical protein
MMFQECFRPSGERRGSSDTAAPVSDNAVQGLNRIRSIRKIKRGMVQGRTEMADITEKLSNDASHLPWTVTTSHEGAQMVFQRLDAAAVLEHEGLPHGLIDFLSRLPSGNGCFPSSATHLELGDQMKVAALENPAIFLHDPL